MKFIITSFILFVVSSRGIVAEDVASSSLDSENCSEEKLRESSSGNITNCRQFRVLPLLLCGLQCPEFFVKSRSFAACVNGQSYPASCVLNSSIVETCERNMFQSCPYNESQVLQFYRTDGINQNDTLPQSERLDQVDLRDIESGVELVEDNWSSSAVEPGFCMRRFCSKDLSTTDFTRPRICGTLRNAKRRVRCLECRLFECSRAGVF